VPLATQLWEAQVGMFDLVYLVSPTFWTTVIGGGIGWLVAGTKGLWAGGIAGFLLGVVGGRIFALVGEDD
jgi:hypothetical protein